VHALVLVSKLHRPTLRALAYARATRPSVLEAISVNVDPDETAALQAEWQRRDIPVTLKSLDSPYREITRPIVDYVRSVRRGSPRDVVVVYVPEYVVGHWWEALLHNQSAFRLKTRLRFMPGVMVASVPWQLASSHVAESRMDGDAPGSVRRGTGGSRGPSGAGDERPTGAARRRRGRALSGGESLVGVEVEVDVGPVAHGGHCVARHEGRVLFVRHTLPGERVVARVTEGSDGDRYLRADAIAVITPSADRVVPRCPVARPGMCGGCDWQHVTLEAQRRLKADVVREQLQRLAGLDLEVVVEPVPGDADGLDWRTRMQFAVGDGDALGLRKHRSHEVVPVATCPIAHPGVDAAGVTASAWPGVRAVEVAVPSAPGEAPLVVVEPVAGRPRLPALAASVAVAGAGSLERVTGRTWVREAVETGDWQRDFRVTGSGFWQVHPGAAATLVAAVLQALAPQAGEQALDLYAGVGLFAAALGDAVGPEGRCWRSRATPAPCATPAATCTTCRTSASRTGASTGCSPGCCDRGSRPTW
jgi:hypothetical protein